jgi:hypothetical protein
MKTENDKHPLDSTKNSAVEREMAVNGARIQIKGIFTGKTSLDAAWERIIIRKAADKNTI